MTEAETRIVQALERLAAAMERAYPDPAKQAAKVSMAAGTGAAVQQHDPALVTKRSLVTGLPLT